jgi:hypothetical protein
MIKRVLAAFAFAALVAVCANAQMSGVKSCFNSSSFISWVDSHPESYTPLAAQTFRNDYAVRCGPLDEAIAQAKRLLAATRELRRQCRDDHYIQLGREVDARVKEWLRLEDQYRGIITYRCAGPAWALVGETCYAYVKAQATDLWPGVCHFSLSDAEFVLCEEPAKPESAAGEVR